MLLSQILGMQSYGTAAWILAFNVHVQVARLRHQGDCAMARTVGADRARRGVKRCTEVVSAATAVDDAQTTHARGQATFAFLIKQALEL
jgi:hypothetical protein